MNLHLNFSFVSQTFFWYFCFSKKVYRLTTIDLFMVPVTGLEPVRYRYRRILSYLLHTEYKRTQTPMEVVNGHLKARNY